MPIDKTNWSVRFADTESFLILPLEPSTGFLTRIGERLKLSAVDFHPSSETDNPGATQVPWRQQSYGSAQL